MATQRGYVQALVEYSVHCMGFCGGGEGGRGVKHLDSTLHLCLVSLPSLILKPTLYYVLFSILICSPILIHNPILICSPILVLSPILILGSIPVLSPVLRLLCVNCVYAAGFGVQGGERLSHR